MLCVCDYRPNKSLSKDVRNTFYLLRKNRFNIWLWIRGNYLTNRKDPLMYQRCNFTNDCRTYFRQPQSENKCFERFYSTKTTYIMYQKVVAFILLPRCEKKKIGTCCDNLKAIYNKHQTDVAFILLPRYKKN